MYVSTEINKIFFDGWNSIFFKFIFFTDVPFFIWNWKFEFQINVKHYVYVILNNWVIDRLFTLHQYTELEPATFGTADKPGGTPQPPPDVSCDVSRDSFIDFRLYAAVLSAIPDQ